MDKPTYSKIATIIKHNIEDKIKLLKHNNVNNEFSKEPINFEKTCVYIQGQQITYPPIKEFNIYELYKKFPSLNSEFYNNNSNSNSNDSNK